MAALLKALEARGPPDADDSDIGAQLLRVMQEHPGISRDRVLSEIGILFVEGFETTGACCAAAGVVHAVCVQLSCLPSGPVADC
jgi:hypothetical protein